MLTEIKTSAFEKATRIALVAGMAIAAGSVKAGSSHEVEAWGAASRPRYSGICGGPGIPGLPEPGTGECQLADADEPRYSGICGGPGIPGLPEPGTGECQLADDK